jgi:hypothetical protein
MSTPVVDQATLVKEITEFNAAKETLYNKLKAEQMSSNLPSTIFKIQAPPSNTNKATMQDYHKYQAEFKALFTDHYNSITQLRAKHFELIDQLNQRIRDQETEIAELNGQHNKLQTGVSTQFRNLKNQKYLLAKESYFHHLYLVFGVAQVFVLLLLILVHTGSVPLSTGLMVFSIVTVCVLLYTGYYVFLRKMNRDAVVFDRYKYAVDRDYKSAMSGCPENRAKERQKEAELEKRIKGMLSSSSGSCPVYNTVTTNHA